MPRRATTRRSGNAGSAVGFAALVALLVMLGAGAVWLFDPYSWTRQLAAPPMLGLTSQGAGPGVASTSSESAATALHLAEVAPPGATITAVGRTPSLSNIKTVREWDPTPAGVITDPALVQRLDQALAGVDGRVSVAVKDLGSGRGAVLDGNLEVPAASLYKLPILFAVFEAGLNMGEQLPITEEARAYDSGTLELGVGESLSVAEALERMVTISDNTAAVMLGSRAGPGRVNADIAALGMDSTHYSLERMTTSAADMLRYLDLLAHGKMVSAAASADMLHLLLRQRVNDRLPRLLPGGVEVAHKTGNLPGTVNDVGIIYGASSTVAIVALVSDTTDETAAASGIAHLALAATTYFEDQPEVTSRPTIPRAPTRAIPPVWREPHPVPTPEPTALPEDPSSALAAASTPTPAVGRPTPLPAATPAPAVAPTPRPTPAPAAPTATPAPPPASPTPVHPTRTPPRATTLPPTPVAPAKR